MTLKKTTTEIERIAKLAIEFRNDRNKQQTQLEKELKKFEIDTIIFTKNLIDSQCVAVGIKSITVEKLIKR